MKFKKKGPKIERRVLFLNDVCSETDQSETSINETPPKQNNIIADKNRRKFSRDLLIMRRRLSYRLSTSVE